MLFYNGKIFTGDKNNEFFEAMLISGDKIEKLGTNEEIRALKQEHMKCIDLKGKVLIPGFNDSHMHLYGFGQTLQIVDLVNVQSVEEVISRGKKYISDNNIKSNVWIRGRGWNQDYFTDKKFPTREDLDKISINHPIIFTRACGHLAVVNSKALENCKVENVAGGEFDLDKGIFKEHAISLITDNIPKPSVAEIKNTLTEAMKYANSKGITSVQTDDLSHGGDYKLMLKAYEELNHENKLTCRVYEQCLLDLKQLKAFYDLGYKTGVGDKYFKIGPLKILVDGSLGARTAALNKPYHDDNSTNGVMCYTNEELDHIISYADKIGMQIAIHCIGDRAMQIVLDSYKRVLKADGNLKRHGIIHCQIMDADLLSQFKNLDIIAYIQPIFLHYDLHIVESRVGKKLAKTSYAFKSMIDEGIHTSLGTDCPVEDCDVMANIYCAVNRVDLKGEPAGGYNPKEKLSVYEALYHYTQGSAYASFEERIKGTITEGKLADFVVIDKDIMNMDPLDIKNITILATYVGGKLVYKKS